MLIARLDFDLGAQPIQLQLLQQGVAGTRCNIQQDGAIAFHQEEVEADLALGREQGGIEPAPRRQPFHVIADQILQKGPRLRPGKADYGAVVEAAGLHGPLR